MITRSIDDVTDIQELLTLTPMSYSRLNSYKSCAAQYFYTYVVRAPRVFSSPAVLGNIIHTALENTLERDVVISKLSDSLFEEYKEQIPIWDPESTIPPNMLDDGEIMLQEFIDRHSHESFPIEDKEYGFAMVIAGALIAGYIDRVDIVDDIVYVVDWKTGKHEVALKRISEDLQLGIYALAMKVKYPDKKIHASLYYLRSGRQKGHLFTDEDFIRIEEELIEKINEVREDKYFKVTPNRHTCKYMCDHGKSGMCPVGSKVV
jgi:RecB family exonuclease